MTRNFIVFTVIVTICINESICYIVQLWQCIGAIKLIAESCQNLPTVVKFFLLWFLVLLTKVSGKFADGEQC